MSGQGNSNQIFGMGSTPFVPTQSLWQWNTSGIAGAPSGQPQIPTVAGFPVGISQTYPTGFAPTKTGLQAVDLCNFAGVPLQYYGNPPRPVPDTTLLQWIRFAEDRIEQETSILLCQTWVASPPTQSVQITQAAGILPQTSAGYQIRGYDYDLEDAAYDFQFPRWQDEGWGYLTLRYRPVQSYTYGVAGSGATAATQGLTAIKNTSFIYPLLTQFFRMPSSWNVEDRDFGLVRYVPATNTQMLPLFAMQLAFMGFNEDVPGAMWLQYTAGLTPFDYAGRYSFMKELVLLEATITALATIQGTINLGAKSVQMTVDGMSYKTDYDPLGPFAGLIKMFMERKKGLMDMAKNLVSGPMVNVL